MRYTALSLLALVIYLSSHFLRAQAFPSDDLVLKLKLALSDPENAESFNEIDRTFDEELANPMIALFARSYDNPARITPEEEITTTTTTTTTTQLPTQPEGGNGSDTEKAISSLLRRRMMGFLSSWMQIRHLMRLAS